MMLKKKAKETDGKIKFSESQNTKNIENQKRKQEEIEKYQNYYKNILWIDDDCGENINENFKWLNDSDSNSGNVQYKLKNSEECYGIKTVKYFSDAVKEVNEKSYDLVIFDINLENGFKLSGNKKNELSNEVLSNEDKDRIEEITYTENIFNAQNIEFKYDDFEEKNENQKIAGEYLYLLLLSKGYPQNRMVIYTNNYEEFQKNSKLSKANLFNFDGNSLFISKNDSIDINKYFNDNNGYYRVRRLIYQACDYWERELNSFELTKNAEINNSEKDIKKKNVPFNDLYELDVEISSFKDMLSQIKMMFPVIIPCKPEEVYYQAMHIVSMFHEENAKIDKVKSKGNIFPYHQMIRNFRNWSSHNKFKKSIDLTEKDKFSADQFAFLFCVALRTYFDTQKYYICQGNCKKSKYEYCLSDKIYYYENVYFNNLKNITWKDVNDKISFIWKNMISDVYFYGGRNNQEYLLKSAELHTLLQRLGDQKNFSMPFYYINLSMFLAPFEIHKDYCIPKETKELDHLFETLDEIINVNVNFSYTLKKVDTIEYKSKFVENKANEFFERIAFSLFP